MKMENELVKKFMDKRVNQIKWLTFFIALVISATTIAGKNMTKFDWRATESAPKNYPMKILSGSLGYHDKSGSLYVPSGVTLYNGWGKGRSSHIVGEDFKPLPDRLSITFFSYTENQFYKGKFDLPYDKILALFNKGFYSPLHDKDITYDRIVTGVAPGGYVTVWLWGYEKRIEVFHGQAEKADIEWGKFTNATHISREENIRLILDESLKTPEAIETLKKNGVPLGLWESYSKRYNWKPVFSGIDLRDKRIGLINYLNGEQDYIDYPLNEDVEKSTRAIPRYMEFIMTRKGKKALLIEITFNEETIVKLFEKLSNDNQPLELLLTMDVVSGKQNISVALRNDKETAPLTGTDFKFYGVRDNEAEAAR